MGSFKGSSPRAFLFASLVKQKREMIEEYKSESKIEEDS